MFAFLMTKMVGVAHVLQANCTMATKTDYPSLFKPPKWPRSRSAGGVRWTSQSVVFHNKHGISIELSDRNSVATSRKTQIFDNGTVCTNKPVPIGEMFSVTVRERHEQWAGGLMIGFTQEDPENSYITQSLYLPWHNGDKHLLCVNEITVYSNGKELCGLDFNTEDLAVGQSFGILMTRERDLHWFVDRRRRGVVHVDDYPLDRPMWGVADVFGTCEQVTAEICTTNFINPSPVSSYDKSSESRLMEMGLLRSPEKPKPASLQSTTPKPVPSQRPPDQPVGEDLLHQMLGEQDSLKQQIQSKDEQIQRKDIRIQALQRDLTSERETVTSVRTENRQLQQQTNLLHQQVTQVSQLQEQSDDEIRQLEHQVTQANQQVTQVSQLQEQSDTEIRQLRQQIESLQRRVASLSAIGPNSQEIEFWQVSPEEVTIREDQVLGRGAWGYVAKGTFRGTTVAIKRVYPEILEQTTLERIRREIRTMAQIRHPNLVLFIAAVLNEQTGPMIITELLDTSLRQAYQADRVGANKRRIFIDLSSALLYLHQQREPIIHRDVSTANVLLIALPNDTWLAKLSDFGSANLARYATTPGEGAILYTAPEAYPHPPTSPTPPPPQTSKIDVYSFGVLVCEVVTRTFPASDKFAGLMTTVGRVWPHIHPLITSCISHSPHDRPTMLNVLTRLRQLDSEPSKTV